MTDTELAALVAQSPVRRDESTWLAVKDYLLRRLRELVPGEVRFGPYWIGTGSERGGSLCSRVRCRTALPFVPESDAWEGSFCTSGNETHSWTDLDVFPFRHGRNVRPGGTFWNLCFSANHWTSRGWRVPDGPSEWEWVKQTGNCYLFPRNVCEIARRHLLGRPPIVTVRPINWFGREHHRAPAGTVRVSLHDVRRRGASDELGGETALSLADTSRPAVVVTMRTFPRVTSDEIGLERLPIRGGWVPGKYEVSLRVRYEPYRQDGPEAFVTAPMIFTIH
ncbi:hypothetical protein J8F10_16950 [Gemmata sp. G18]|uniref:Uncharacterized protein n=1 Tax=Gemmata palustris TaxID=2822762 RepID=A0ABS5BUI5_9BACT|nr:hypothetical protein [Gemmata palustris]MBP3956960.1 hypothetical protein [Gemmata palustris]